MRKKILVKSEVSTGKIRKFEGEKKAQKRGNCILLLPAYPRAV